MKKIILMFALMVITFSFPVKAEDQPQTNNSKNIVLHHIKSSTNRPRVPSRLTVGCTYGEGFLAFTLPENVSTLTFLLNNGEEEISGMVTSDNPIAEIPVLQGEYQIECQDDGYRTYVGVLNFND